MQGIAGLAVEFARQAQTDFDEESETIPTERFQWFIGAALVLLVAQWFVAEGRRPARPLRVGRRQTLGAASILGMLLLAALLAGCGGTAGLPAGERGQRGIRRRSLRGGIDCLSGGEGVAA